MTTIRCSSNVPCNAFHSSVFTGASNMSEPPLIYLAGKAEFNDRKIFPLPDVLVVDTTLGGPAELPDLFRWLASREEFSELTKVALTGGMNPKAHAALLQQGVAEVLTKGGTFEELSLSVEKVLVRCVR